MLLSLQKIKPFNNRKLSSWAVWLLGVPLATALPAVAYVHKTDSNSNKLGSKQKSFSFRNSLAKTNQSSRMESHISQTQAQATTSTGSASDFTSTNLKVNGQSISVPLNGSVHKVISNQNSTTLIDAQNTHTQTGSSQHTSSTVQVHTQSHGGSVNINQNIH